MKFYQLTNKDVFLQAVRSKTRKQLLEIALRHYIKMRELEDRVSTLTLRLELVAKQAEYTSVWQELASEGVPVHERGPHQRLQTLHREIDELNAVVWPPARSL